MVFCMFLVCCLFFFMLFYGVVMCVGLVLVCGVGGLFE